MMTGVEARPLHSPFHQLILAGKRHAAAQQTARENCLIEGIVIRRITLRFDSMISVAFDRHVLREPYGLPELTVLSAFGRVTPPRLEIAQSAAPENLLRSSRGDENLASMPPGTCRRSRQLAENLRSRNCRSADTQFAAAGRKSNGPLQYVL